MEYQYDLVVSTLITEIKMSSTSFVSCLVLLEGHRFKVNMIYF